MKLTSIALIVTTAACTVGTQMLLKSISTFVFSIIPELSLLNIYRLIQFALTNPIIPLAVTLQGFGFIIWIIALSREHAVIALGIGGASVYILTALTEALLFNAKFTWYQLFALLLVTLGALLLAIFTK
jgi:hypothetical protein